MRYFLVPGVLLLSTAIGLDVVAPTGLEPSLWHICDAVMKCTGIVLPLATFVYMQRQQKRIRELHYDVCPQCGYNLRGLPDAYHCPECGRYFIRAMLPAEWEH